MMAALLTGRLLVVVLNLVAKELSFVSVIRIAMYLFCVVRAGA